MEAVDDLESKRDRQRDEQQEELSRAKRVEDFHGCRFLQVARFRIDRMKPCTLRRPMDGHKPPLETHQILTLRAFHVWACRADKGRRTVASPGA
jgi:hypothetical protein